MKTCTHWRSTTSSVKICIQSRFSLDVRLGDEIFAAGIPTTSKFPMSCHIESLSINASKSSSIVVEGVGGSRERFRFLEEAGGGGGGPGSESFKK